MRVQLDSLAQRALQQSVDVLERMIRAVARAEAPEIRRLDAELLADLATRPDLDALAVLRGEHDLVAHSLFLLFVARQVQPALRREIAIDLLAKNDALEQVAISQGQSEDDRRLSLAFRLHDRAGESRIPAPQECHALARQSLVHTDRVLGKELEVAAIPAAGFAGGLSLL